MTSYLTIENNSRVLLINLKIVTTGIKFKRAELLWPFLDYILTSLKRRALYL